MLEEKIKRHKMNDASVSKKLSLESDETYYDIDLYHELVKWRGEVHSY